MDQYIDLAEIESLLQTARDWVLLNVMNWQSLVQAVLLLALFLVAGWLAGRFRPPLERRVAELRGPEGLRRVSRQLVAHARPILFLGLTWLAIGILQRTSGPDPTYLLRLVASLATAWVVISLTSKAIRNPAFARVVAVIAWTAAALNITGLLGPTLETLDALALTLGDLRISLLTVVKGMATLGILLWAAVAFGRLLEIRITRAPSLTPSIQVLLSKLLKFTLIALAVVLALNSIGIDLTALTVLSGAIGLGVGFGLQRVVSNLISGVILLLDKSVKPGDVIELEETFGWITTMGARYISVVTRDGKEYLIPNEDLITHRVVNWSYSDQLVRLELRFGVSYRSDPHAVRRIACEAAVRPSRVVEKPAPVCHLRGFGDSSLDFLLRFWIRDPQAGVANVTGEVLLAVWDAFQAEGIAIPYPHREVFLHDAERERARA
ncbi:MAG TPA: mechanosensitive ion channel domain-containing protein, partial [Kiloniellales bacterium]|nr:mechanosensitive ion channel domain-containing protein [Kiloniellales bacterium]